MNDKNPRRGGLTVGWAGALACAAALSFVQWNMNAASDEAPELRTLLAYALVNFTCFSFILLIAGWRPGGTLWKLSAVALAGALASGLLIDVPFLYRDLPSWRGDVAGWLARTVFFLVLDCCVAAVAMTLVYFSSAIVKVRYR